MAERTSALLEEFIEAVAAGEPAGSDWLSIDENARNRKLYHARLDELRREIDRRIPATTQPEDAE